MSKKSNIITKIIPLFKNLKNTIINTIGWKLYHNITNFFIPVGIIGIIINLSGLIDNNGFKMVILLICLFLLNFVVIYDEEFIDFNNSLPNILFNKSKRKFYKYIYFEKSIMSFSFNQLFNLFIISSLVSNLSYSIIWLVILIFLLEDIMAFIFSHFLLLRKLKKKNGKYLVTLNFCFNYNIFCLCMEYFDDNEQDKQLPDNLSIVLALKQAIDRKDKNNKDSQKKPRITIETTSKIDSINELFVEMKYSNTNIAKSRKNRGLIIENNYDIAKILMEYLNFCFRTIENKEIENYGQVLLKISEISKGNYSETLKRIFETLYNPLDVIKFYSISLKEKSISYRVLIKWIIGIAASLYTLIRFPMLIFEIFNIF